MKNSSKPQELNIKPSAKVAIVISSYHSDITSPMLESAKETLLKNGVSKKNISLHESYGAFELPYMAQRAILSSKPDVVITLGCIIRGETPHFDFVAMGTTQGIIEVGIKHNLPVIFGVLTVDNLEQAKARIKGGKRGDKGEECAHAALKAITYNLKAKT